MTVTFEELGADPFPFKPDEHGKRPVYDPWSQLDEEKEKDFQDRQAVLDSHKSRYGKELYDGSNKTLQESIDRLGFSDDDIFTFNTSTGKNRLNMLSSYCAQNGFEDMAQYSNKELKKAISGENKRYDGQEYSEAEKDIARAIQQTRLDAKREEEIRPINNAVSHTTTEVSQTTYSDIHDAEQFGVGSKRLVNSVIPTYSQQLESTSKGMGIANEYLLGNVIAYAYYKEITAKRDKALYSNKSHWYSSKINKQIDSLYNVKEAQTPVIYRKIDNDINRGKASYRDLVNQIKHDIRKKKNKRDITRLSTHDLYNLAFGKERLKKNDDIAAYCRLHKLDVDFSKLGRDELQKIAEGKKAKKDGSQYTTDDIKMAKESLFINHSSEYEEEQATAALLLKHRAKTENVELSITLGNIGLSQKDYRENNHRKISRAISKYCKDNKLGEDFSRLDEKTLKGIRDGKLKKKDGTEFSDEDKKLARLALDNKDGERYGPHTRMAVPSFSTYVLKNSSIAASLGAVKTLKRNIKLAQTAALTAAALGRLVGRRLLKLYHMPLRIIKFLGRNTKLGRITAKKLTNSKVGQKYKEIVKRNDDNRRAKNKKLADKIQRKKDKKERINKKLGGIKNKFMSTKLGKGIGKIGNGFGKIGNGFKAIGNGFKNISKNIKKMKQKVMMLLIKFLLAIAIGLFLFIAIYYMSILILNVVSGPVTFFKNIWNSVTNWVSSWFKSDEEETDGDEDIAVLGPQHSYIVLSDILNLNEVWMYQLENQASVVRPDLLYAKDNGTSKIEGNDLSSYLSSGDWISQYSYYYGLSYSGKNKITNTHPDAITNTKGDNYINKWTNVYFRFEDVGGTYYHTFMPDNTYQIYAIVSTFVSYYPASYKYDDASWMSTVYSLSNTLYNDTHNIEIYGVDGSKLKSEVFSSSSQNEEFAISKLSNYTDQVYYKTSHNIPYDEYTLEIDTTKSAERCGREQIYHYDGYITGAKESINTKDGVPIRCDVSLGSKISEVTINNTTTKIPCYNKTMELNSGTLLCGTAKFCYSSDGNLNNANADHYIKTTINTNIDKSSVSVNNKTVNYSYIDGSYLNTTMQNETFNTSLMKDCNNAHIYINSSITYVNGPAYESDLSSVSGSDKHGEISTSQNKLVEITRDSYYAYTNKVSKYVVTEVNNLDILNPIAVTTRNVTVEKNLHLTLDFQSDVSTSEIYSDTKEAIENGTAQLLGQMTETLIDGVHYKIGAYSVSRTLDDCEGEYDYVIVKYKETNAGWTKVGSTPNGSTQVATSTFTLFNNDTEFNAFKSSLETYFTVEFRANTKYYIVYNEDNQTWGLILGRINKITNSVTKTYPITANNTSLKITDVVDNLGENFYIETSGIYTYIIYNIGSTTYTSSSSLNENSRNPLDRIFKDDIGKTVTPETISNHLSFKMADGSDIETTEFTQYTNSSTAFNMGDMKFDYSYAKCSNAKPKTNGSSVKTKLAVSFSTADYKIKIRETVTYNQDIYRYSYKYTDYQYKVVYCQHVVKETRYFASDGGTYSMQITCMGHCQGHVNAFCKGHIDAFIVGKVNMANTNDFIQDTEAVTQGSIFEKAYALFENTYGVDFDIPSGEQEAVVDDSIQDENGNAMTFYSQWDNSEIIREAIKSQLNYGYLSAIRYTDTFVDPVLSDEDVYTQHYSDMQEMEEKTDILGDGSEFTYYVTPDDAWPDREYSPIFDVYMNKFEYNVLKDQTSDTYPSDAGQYMAQYYLKQLKFQAHTVDSENKILWPTSEVNWEFKKVAVSEGAAVKISKDVDGLLGTISTNVSSYTSSYSAKSFYTLSSTYSSTDSESIGAFYVVAVKSGTVRLVKYISASETATIVVDNDDGSVGLYTGISVPLKQAGSTDSNFCTGLLNKVEAGEAIGLVSLKYNTNDSVTVKYTNKASYP